MKASRGWLVVVALALLAGCAEAPELDDPDTVRTWANAVSPVAVFLQVYDPVSQSYAQPGVYPDAACPVVTDDGTTLAITGGCTDSTGQSWLGSAQVVRSGSSDRDVTLDGYGHSADVNGDRATGTAAIRELADGSHSFEVHVVVAGRVTSTIDYEGTVAGFYGDAVTVWNGQGTVVRTGSARPTGMVTATTVDQRLDSVCSGESASGTTTIEADGHTVVITYDGATDCDAEHSARWSFDGEDRGLVIGISCAASPTGAARGASLVGLLLLALMAAGGRRLSRRPPATKELMTKWMLELPSG